jgi:hypothetical protein
MSPFTQNASRLGTALLPIAGSIANGVIGSNAAGNATNALTAGGQQAINTITQGQQNAQNTLNSTVASQQGLFQPWVTAGQGATSTLAAGTQPGGSLVQPFSWTPADLANDPAYQFRLQQGMKAINAQGAASGNRFSGATLKSLADYNAGTTAQYENQDYNQGFNTYQYNQQTQLKALQDLSQQGLNAAGGSSTALGSYATNTTNLDTGTAKAIADLQTSIASAQAQGDYNKASALQQTLSGIVSGAQQVGTLFPGGTQKTQPPLTNDQSAPGYVGPTDAQLGTAQNSPNFVGPTQPGPGATGASVAGAGGAAAAAAPTVAGASGAAAGGGDLSALGGVLADPGIAAPGVAPGIAGATGASLAGDAGAAAAAGAGAAGASGAGAGAAAAFPGAIGSGLPGAALPAADAGAAGGSGFLGAASSFLTNPITIGVGAALIGGYALIKGLQTRGVADNFVQGYQNKFVNTQGTGTLNKVVDGFDKALASGQLSKADAQSMRDQTAQFIQQYEAAGAQFAAKGDKQASVWNQAQRTMAQDFGGTVDPTGHNNQPDWSKILGKMDQEIQGLAA